MSKGKNCDKGYACSAACISRAKSCDGNVLREQSAKYAQWLAKALHGGDHLAESMIAWKSGKLIGTAIASAIGIHGAPRRPQPKRGWLRLV